MPFDRSLTRQEPAGSLSDITDILLLMVCLSVRRETLDSRALTDSRARKEKKEALESEVLE